MVPPGDPSRQHATWPSVRARAPDLARERPPRVMSV